MSYKIKFCICVTPEIHFISMSQTPSTNPTIRGCDVSHISLLLTLHFSITSRHITTTLLLCSHGSIKDCLILQVSLDSNFHLYLTVHKSAMLI
jgi:hypothetical protein